jgi:hypothetical protein
LHDIFLLDWPGPKGARLFFVIADVIAIRAGAYPCRFAIWLYVIEIRFKRAETAF